MHWSYPIPIVLEGWANLYTIHDAIPLLKAELTPIDPVRHRKLLTQIISVAAAIVTVSDSARSEIVAATGCEPTCIADCGQAADLRAWSPETPLPEGLQRHGYLLACGSIEPRKNILRLLAAHRELGDTLPLVFAGPDGWRAEEYHEALQSPLVRRIGEVERTTMLSLIAGARTLLMPSLAEGFGLPALEAMALGTPVIASRGGALAEVTAGAAILVDPLATSEIAGAIRRITSDHALHTSLAARGRERARAFTPERFAARLDALYSAVAPAI